jgi:hypothetical protein
MEHMRGIVGLYAGKFLFSMKCGFAAEMCILHLHMYFPVQPRSRYLTGSISIFSMIFKTPPSKTQMFFPILPIGKLEGMHLFCCFNTRSMLFYPFFLKRELLLFAMIS